MRTRAESGGPVKPAATDPAGRHAGAIGRTARIRDDRAISEEEGCRTCFVALRRSPCRLLIFFDWRAGGPGDLFRPAARRGFRAKAAHGLQPVVAVGRPAAIRVTDDDHRIEKAAERLDHRHQTASRAVPKGRVERRRLDAIDRKRDDQDRRAAERVAVGAEHGASVALHDRRERIGRARTRPRFCRREADRRGGLLSSTDRLLLPGRATSPIRHLGMRGTPIPRRRTTRLIRGYGASAPSDGAASTSARPDTSPRACERDDEAG